MEFRKMVTITLYTRQQKRRWCIEQAYGLCGRGRGWEDLGEQHWNMWNVMYETRCQSRFNARCWMLGAGALGRPRGMVWGGGGRRVQDGEHMRNKGIKNLKKKKKIHCPQYQRILFTVHGIGREDCYFNKFSDWSRRAGRHFCKVSHPYKRIRQGSITLNCLYCQRDQVSLCPGKM